MHLLPASKSLNILGVRPWLQLKEKSRKLVWICGYVDMYDSAHIAAFPVSCLLSERHSLPASNSLNIVGVRPYTAQHYGAMETIKSCSLFFPLSI
jgi:hypothetical protein